MIDGIELLRTYNVRLDAVRAAVCAIDDELAVVPVDQLEPWLRRVRFHVDYDDTYWDRNPAPPGAPAAAADGHWWRTRCKEHESE